MQTTADTKGDTMTEWPTIYGAVSRNQAERIYAIAQKRRKRYGETFIEALDTLYDRGLISDAEQSAAEDYRDEIEGI